jgi:putative tryptophan/tyrosine transport system substrate-binding protein
VNWCHRVGALMMRFDLLALGVLTILLSVGPAAFGQAPERVYRLGVLSPSSGTLEQSRAEAFPELARLGFVEGQNLVVEARFGPTEQLPALARELASVHPDVVIAAGGAAIRAMRQAAVATPIVGALIGEDPVAAGFAASLARPGGMITGIVMLAPELDGKRLQVLHEAVPGAHKIAALAPDPKRAAPNLAAVREAADRLDIELFPVFTDTLSDYGAAFAAMRNAGADALEIISDPELFTNAPRLAALAIEARLPTVCEWAEMARSGCLLGYGPHRTELQHRVANYIARIFAGAAPGDLPIEQPVRYNFAINLKTANALGVTIPPSILARADEVIE